MGRTTRHAFLACATTLLLAPLAALHAAEPSKPNIIIILADDLGVPGKKPKKP